MENKKKLVIVLTRGLDDERASVAFSIANAGINNGMDVTLFLVSSGADWVRKKAADKIRQNPVDPTLGEMLRSFLDSGCKIGVCPPCAEMRGYSADDLIEGVVITGPTFIFDPMNAGASTLTF